MTTSTKPVTAEQLSELGDIGPCELVRGELIPMAPAGFDHGDVAMQIGYLIKQFVAREKLGKVLAAETGFLIARDPDVVRGADVAFVGRSRLPGRKHGGFLLGSPDLVVEVVSPSDRSSEVGTKVDEWIKGGATSVWVVDPRTRSIEVHRQNQTTSRLHGTAVLDNEPALPGFSMKLSDAFDID